MTKFFTSMEKRGGNILHRYVENGVRRQESVPFSPELFIHGQQTPGRPAINTKGDSLSRIGFNTMREMSDYIEQYKGVDGYKIYGTRDPLIQFASKTYPNKVEFDATKIHGAIIDIEVFSGDILGGEYVAGPFPEPVDAKYPISMLTLFNTNTLKFEVWAVEYFKGKHLGTYTHDPLDEHVGSLDISYHGFKTEAEMLGAFTLYMQSCAFDYMSGWYFEEFDTPYIVNRIEKVLGSSFVSKLSPWGIVKERTIKTPEREINTYDFLGVSTLDMLNLYKKHAGIEPANWKLDTIAKLMKVGNKIDYTEEGDLGGLYINNFQKAVVYNIIDVELVRRLENKKQMALLTFVLAYMAKVNYRDTLATVKPWSSQTYDKLNSKGVQPEIRSVYQGTIDIVGGFVREVVPAKYKWVVSFDLNSLYPHLMQQFNLGVETILEPHEVPVEVQDTIPVNFTIDDLVDEKIDLSVLNKYNIAMTANRQFFKKDRMSIFSEMTREIYANRAAVKKEMKVAEQKMVNTQDPTEKAALESDISVKNTVQLAFKLSMNSLYGATANRYFTDFFDVRVAEGITTSGQTAIRWVMKRLNIYFNNLLKTDGVDYIVAGDTDSVYVTMDALAERLFKGTQNNPQNFDKVTDTLNRFITEKVEPFIDNCYKQLADYMNAYEQRMFMKRETIAPVAIWAAKKRYTMLATDVEGVRYPEPIVKYTGLDAKRSNIPEKCRAWLVESYKIAMLGNEDDIQKFVKEKQVEYQAFTVEQISAVTGINGIEKYSDHNGNPIKGAPKHVKAALAHNRILKERGIQHIRPIAAGNKILMVGLKQNPQNIEFIGYQGKFPPEFNLIKYVDYKTSFTGNFVSPLENLITHLKWSAEKQASLGGLFV